MPRTQTVSRSRFTAQPGEVGSSIVAGYKDAVADKYDKKFVRRNLEPYKKYGLPQKVSKLEGKSDTALYNMAARAVLRKFKASDDDDKPKRRDRRAAPPRRRVVVRPPSRSAQDARRASAREAREAAERAARRAAARERERIMRRRHRQRRRASQAIPLTQRPGTNTRAVPE